MGSNVGVSIDWVEDVTLMQKLNEYYIRTFLNNIIISSIVAVIPTFIVGKLNKKNKLSVDNKNINY